MRNVLLAVVTTAFLACPAAASAADRLDVYVGEVPRERLADIVALGVETGVPREALAAGPGTGAIKARLRELTDEAVAAGVTGIPTVRVGERLFWGDDRLEDAAAALPMQ